MLGWSKEDIVAVFVCIVVCELAGVVGSFFTFPSITPWYSTLNKPPFTPPGWVFGPVWITLYALMGLSLFLVWHSKKNMRSSEDGLLQRDNLRTDWKGVEAVDFALTVFGVQLLLNVFWSFLFFGLHQTLLALFGIIALWVSIAACIISFWRISRVAALLLFPYIAWVTVAGVLNYFVWILN